eukprot:c31018_g1_i1 orf=74-271(+)
MRLTSIHTLACLSESWRSLNEGKQGFVFSFHQNHHFRGFLSVVVRELAALISRQSRITITSEEEA